MASRRPLIAYVLCEFADQRSLYTSWLDRCPIPHVIVRENPDTWELPDDAGIVISHMHYRHQELAKLRQIHAQNEVPVLILADGILEYRNTWQHLDLPDGSIFQPLFGHKLACIGHGQARVVESWGNVGKCEIVGLPRLDGLLSQPTSDRSNEGPFRLLIATANTPSFDDRQRETVVESLSQVHQWLADNQQVGRRQLEVTWRLTDGLEKSIGLSVESDSQAVPLETVINQVDAVLTTPSTLYFESILRRVPTAILDFHNCPQYVPSAWTISAPGHIEDTLSELTDPPAARMLYQDWVLAEQLECRSPAGDRMIELISAMVACRQASLDEGKPLQLPARILADPNQGFSRVSESFDLKTLFPNNTLFDQQDAQRQQIEFAAALQRIADNEEEFKNKEQRLAKKDEHLKGKDEQLEFLNSNLERNSAELDRKAKKIEEVSQLLQKNQARVAELSEQLKEKQAQVREMNARIADLRSRLGIE